MYLGSKNWRHETLKIYYRYALLTAQMISIDFDLQCAMPVCEGLFPEKFDGFIQDLLFDLATWHAYAKLRMHTDSTLKSFKKATSSLGRQMRRFASKVCPSFSTKETPNEAAARHRRAAAKLAKGSGSATPAPAGSSGSKVKIFNLFTYKYHALADYVWHIIRFGTTDSYSTQIVSIFMISGSH